MIGGLRAISVLPTQNPWRPQSRPTSLHPGQLKAIGVLVLARSPDLARVLTIRSPSVLSVVLAVVLPDLASTGESREFRYILKIA